MMQFIPNIYKRILFLTCVMFIANISAYAQDSGSPDSKGNSNNKDIPGKDKNKIKSKQDSINTKFLQTISDKLNIKKYVRKEKQKIINHLDSLLNIKFASDTSIQNFISRGNDYSVKGKKQLDAIVLELLCMNKEKKLMNKKLDTILVHQNDELTEEEQQNITIDQLAEKIIPLVQEELDNTEHKKSRVKKINTYRSLLINPNGIVDTLVINNILSKKYTLKIGERREVFGFHPYWRKSNYQDYNFDLITTLAYYGYELNGRTGLPKNTHEWETAEVVRLAEKKGCKVVLSVFCTNTAELSYFMTSDAAQEKFIATVIERVKLRNANGVNLMFDMPKGDNRQNMLKFVRKLSDGLKAAGKDYLLSITLPVVDEFFSYDVKYLNLYVNHFIIDFSKRNSYGSIVPLTGNNYSLEKGIDNYLSKKVPSKKFLACLPYRGGLWDFETNLFNDYVPYSKVNELYVNDYGRTFDRNACAQRTDVVIDGDTLEQLWFDDAKTLSLKYDLVLQNKMGGVAICWLGDDNNDPELLNVLVDKMIVFDSTEVVILKNVPDEKEKEPTFWEKVKKEFGLYKLLFSHPCDFEQHNKAQMKADDYIGHIALGFLILFILTGIYTIAQRRLLGDDWKHNKLFLSILIILVMLVMISGLMFFFLNPEYTSFGHSQDDCETSFFTILQVLGIGFLIGLLAMKLLVFPLIKRKEIP